MEKLNLSYEDQLLVCCARTKMDEEMADKARNLLEHPLDYNYLINKAVNHGVAALLHTNLKAIDAQDRMPAYITEKLETLYYAIASSNVTKYQEIVNILKALNSARIKSIVLKGPAIANTIYGNVALRPFSDVDLLIAKDDLSSVSRILRDLGYVSPEHILPIALYMKYHFNLPFIKKNGHQILIEIHWDLTDRFKHLPMEISKVWDNAKQIAISGVPALIMEPEDLLVYLCHHLDRHGHMNSFFYNQHDGLDFILNDLSSNRLIWFVDIHEVIKKYGKGINWTDIIEKLKKWDKDGCITTSLFLTNCLFPLALDSNVLSALNPARNSSVENLLYKLITRRYSRKGQEDYIIKFYKKKILKETKTFQFRPIRLLYLNHRILSLSILFPLQLVYHNIGRFISRWIHGKFFQKDIT